MLVTSRIDLNIDLSESVLTFCVGLLLFEIVCKHFALASYIDKFSSAALFLVLVAGFVDCVHRCWRVIWQWRSFVPRRCLDYGVPVDF